MALASALALPMGAEAAPSLLTDSVGPLNEPYGVAVSPDGSAVRIIEAADDAVAFLDPATNSITGADVTVSRSPYFGAFDATGSSLFTANYNDSSVSVVTGRTVVTTISLPTGSNPYLIKPAFGSSKLVTMNQGRGGAPGISVIDTATRTIDRTIAADGSGTDQLTSMAVLPSGSTAWITSQDATYLKSVNLSTGAVTPITPTLAGGQEPRAVFVSPDGATLALITWTTNELILMSAATGAVAHRIALGTVVPWAVAFSPDGASAYLLATQAFRVTPQVRSYAVATGALQTTFTFREGYNLPADGSEEEWFTVSPDGATLFVATVSPDAITTINTVDVRTGRLDLVALPSFGDEFGYMTLNPQGNRLYVTNGRSSGLLAVLATAETPGAPTGVTAAAGDGSARVTWTAPADDGGGAITRYTATASPGGQSCTWTAGELACTVTGLGNGTTYAITVTATNRSGTSAASSAASVTPGRTPGAPTAAKATAGLLRASVTWKAPADTGGGITGYTATANPGGATCTTTGALTCTITGLLNTKAYTFTVKARSAGGESAASTATTAVRPYKKLGMRKPAATSTTIRSQVKTTGPGTITQITTNAKNATVCRTTAKPRQKGTSTLTCTLNRATRTALAKKAQTVTVLTTLLTKQGASFAATHRVTLPKAG